MKSSSASIFLKHLISVLSSVTKSKSMAIKSKAEALKARVIMFSLLKGKRLPLAAISHKVHAMLGVGAHQQDDDHESKVNQSQVSSSQVDHLNTSEDDYCSSSYYYYYYNEDNDNGDDDGKYPDLRHCLFDEEDELKLELGDPNVSVIDQVKNSMEQEGEDFKLEDEIDHVADLFITKFHKRMKLQKLESFKRYQEMLARGAA